MPEPDPTLARLVVAGMWAAGRRPADARLTPWSDVARLSRTMAVGLADGDRVAGRVVAVDRRGLRPAEVVAAETAVWVAGGAVRIGGDDPALTIGRRARRSDGEPDLDVDDIVLAVRRSEVGPDDHERRVAGLDADATAVVAEEVRITHRQLAWALRSVQQWLRELLPDPPAAVVVASDRSDPAGVVLTRWWPAVEGARTVPIRPGTLPAVVAEVAPDVVVADAADWHGVAERLREVAPGVRSGSSTLRAGRVIAAGEGPPPAVVAATDPLRRAVGTRIRRRAGFGSVVAGVCLGGLRQVDGRDLEACGLPVVPTWLEPGLAAPVAAGVAGSGRMEGWGRPLPGRVVDAGRPTTVGGGDLPAAAVVRSTSAAGHRVRLPGGAS